MTPTPATAPVTVSSLQRSEAGSAASVLGAALHNDPGWTHVIPDPRHRARALHVLLGVAVHDALRFGRPMAARRDGVLLGVAVWLPPGRYPMSVTRKLAALAPLAGLSIAMPRHARSAARFGASIDAHFPSERVWYLQVLGVRPDAQRGGVGRALLVDGLAEADRTGTPCYLETALHDNIAYYERHGFVLLDPPAPLYPEGPVMARMRR